MSIKLPAGLPAADRLREEGITVADDGSGLSRPVLRIALVNLMPRKEATELAFARLLAQTGHAVELTLLVPANYQPRNVSAEHIEHYYRRWPEIRDEAFDGLIVTGAPVETLRFEEVSYWNEIREIFGWAKTNVGRALYICWAAQAALYASRGIGKHMLPEKAFGVFEQTVRAPSSPLVRGMGLRFPVPVSRHTAISEQALVAAGLTPLVRSAETGACLIEDGENRAVYLFDHLEYDGDTLQREYDRDREAGKAIAPPRVAQPGWPWQPYAALFFRNWLDTISSSNDQPDPALVWLFQDNRNKRPAGAEVLLQASTRPYLLAEVLRCLDRAGISACSARIRRHGRRTAAVLVELGDQASLSVEHAAGALTWLPGARRVLYRSADGSGGVLRPAPVRARLTRAA